MELKKYVYTKGANAAADQDFELDTSYGRVKLGNQFIFWKKGLRWYGVEVKNIERAYRRVEEVSTKICCGPANFDIQKLRLVLKDGEELELLVGEGNIREAEALYRELQEKHPQIQYGKLQQESGCTCACTV